MFNLNCKYSLSVFFFLPTREDWCKLILKITKGYFSFRRGGRVDKKIDICNCSRSARLTMRSQRRKVYFNYNSWSLFNNILHVYPLVQFITTLSSHDFSTSWNLWNSSRSESSDYNNRWINKSLHNFNQDKAIHVIKYSWNCVSGC